MEWERISFCPFVKYHGNGNDFILIDGRFFAQFLLEPAWIQKICHRHYGVGGDGVIFLGNSGSADYRMRIFNSDGGEASMCGNGIRCLILFIEKLGDTRSEWKIETAKEILRCRKEKDEIFVNLGIPTIVSWPEVGQTQNPLFVVDTGVPHAVVFEEDLSQTLVEERGRKIRFSSEFSPEGVNVNFAFRKGEREWAVRTYERGVEKETMACGTGAAAVAFVAARLSQKSLPIKIVPFSNLDSEGMDFQFFPLSNNHWEIEMKGRAQEVFTGQIPLSLQLRK